jgi:hypothetical protein
MLERGVGIHQSVCIVCWPVTLVTLHLGSGFFCGVSQAAKLLLYTYMCEVVTSAGHVSTQKEHPAILQDSGKGESKY